MGEDIARLIYERGGARWPELPLPFEAFLAHVRPHLGVLASIGLEQSSAEDLFLVAACLQRLPGAVDRFDAFAWPQLERHLRRMERETERLAEMRQVLLVRLFVPDAPGALPRIAEYSGRAPLAAWLRIAAKRLLLNAMRDGARITGLGDSYADKAASGDVELSFIRGRYEEDFSGALREAVGALSDEERLALQLRYREDLNSDQIAVVLKTSRATAARRVVSAREALAHKVREVLRARLDLSQTGLEQLIGLFSTSLVPALAAELRKGLS
jgi:RNA polymerase sigma-70 factor (ECF subfamily)